MFAVLTPAGKVIAIVHKESKAKLIAHRRGERKGRQYRVIPWNG